MKKGSFSLSYQLKDKKMRHRVSWLMENSLFLPYLTTQIGKITLIKNKPLWWLSSRCSQLMRKRKWILWFNGLCPSLKSADSTAYSRCLCWRCTNKSQSSKRKSNAREAISNPKRFKPWESYQESSRFTWLIPIKKHILMISHRTSQPFWHSHWVCQIWFRALILTLTAKWKQLMIGHQAPTPPMLVRATLSFGLVKLNI